MRRKRAGRAFILIFLLAGAVSTALFAADLNPKIHSKVDELKKKSTALISEGKFDKAIPLLEEAVRLSPDDGTLKTQLATAYENQATAVLKRGLSNDALRLLEKAKKISDSVPPSKAILPKEELKSGVEREVIHAKEYALGEHGKGAKELLDDQRANILFEQAFKSFQEKQYSLARGFLKDGIRYNDTNPLAFELLGDIEYFSQNLSAAKDAYDKSYTLSKNERVEKKLAKLAGEQQLDRHLSEYLDEHFVIRYNRKEDVEGSEIRQYLRESYRVISKDFGHYLNYKTVVILYSKSDYHSIEQIPHWSGALFDGKIRIPAYETGVDRNKLRKLIQHELTHVFVSDLSGNHCPIWLHEGLAQYEQDKIVPVDLTLLNSEIKKGAALSAEDLEKGVSEEMTQTQALLFYEQSFSMVTSLLSKHRFIKIKQLLKTLATDEAFDAAFEKTYRTTLAEFVRTWKADSDSKIG